MGEQYSRMTNQELQAEIRELRVLAQKAEAKGMINEYAVHERKILMAEAYMMDPKAYKSKQTYLLKDNDAGETFTISYMNGIFAWGHRSGHTKLEAVPISILDQQLD
ncbi:YfhH family protein [Paenalkalicoccus suaedae]|uniref:YfhH family protein n=1 Tax=Paenalkalicoccus suaedae TaxID=2592382 RepID=A0A859FCD7_9BACI|nr:YfhH family protein [Paenalkalicoccus suaedae]QKS70610.1 YfhH family protein [Paenalkalicoccus suaedae]